MHFFRVVSFGASLLSLLVIHDLPVRAQEASASTKVNRTTDHQDIVWIFNNPSKLPNCIVTCTKAGKVVATVSFVADDAVSMKVQSETAIHDSAKNMMHLQGKPTLRLFRDKKQIMELSADEMSIAIVKK
ncbi:MAG: hypothetical protein EOO38_04470 [Cytophagaceae bacterium]|nr:MAG: hypothetical protein EOO38_04470 [Cytophagaceae bacterium]